MSIDNQKIISRQFAIKNGLDKYFTGKPCKYNHISYRYTKHASCITCLKEYAKKPESILWMKNHNKERRKNPIFIELEKNIRNKTSAKKRKLKYNKTQKMKEWKSK